MRKALFLTAAHYALTEEEVKEIMDHPAFADFLYNHVQAAKKVKYSYYTKGRLYFGEIVFSRHRPSASVQGTSNVIPTNFVMILLGKPRFFQCSTHGHGPRHALLESPRLVSAR